MHLAPSLILATLAVFVMQSAAMAEPASAPELPPKVFEDDFESGHAAWTLFDPDSWRLKQVDGNATFEITTRGSDYKPKHRSPGHVALVRDVVVGDFVLEFDVRSTLDSGGHRDCCVFLGFQDPANFYYVHLGAKPDRVSGQALIVQEAPRRPLTQNTKPIGWDDGWHRVRVARNLASGSIQVYFDDMENPHMEIVDRTFGAGGVGIGSFDDCNEFDNVVLYGERRDK